MEFKGTVAGCHADTGQGEDRTVNILRSLSPVSPTVRPDVMEADSGAVTIPTYVTHRDLWYKMDHKKTGGMRGTCAIINIKKFGGKEERVGTIEDCNEIRRVFGDRLGFDIKIRDDPSSTEIFEVLKQWAEEDHSRSDCFACFVLSHGQEGAITCSDNLSVKVEDIYHEFTETACASLAGKPKLFFIQACRGQKTDKGHPAPTRLQADSSTLCTSFPAHPDLFIFFSTSSGYLSFRQPHAGSVFIQTLCEVINRDYRTRDFRTMMALVRHYVARRNVTYEKYEGTVKQMPDTCSTLTKNLWFAFKSDDSELEESENTAETRLERGKRVLESVLREWTRALPESTSKRKRARTTLEDKDQSEKEMFSNSEDSEEEESENTAERTVRLLGRTMGALKRRYQEITALEDITPQSRTSSYDLIQDILKTTDELIDLKRARRTLERIPMLNLSAATLDRSEKEMLSNGRPPSPRIEDNRDNPDADMNLKILSCTHIEWRPKGIGKLVKLGESGIMYNIASTKFQLNGYLFRLHVATGTTGRNLNAVLEVLVQLRICSSANDDNLAWPFSTPYTIILHHPRDEDFAISKAGSFTPDLPTCYLRPKTSSNIPAWYAIMPVEKLHLNGYVVDDALHLSFKLHT